MLISKTPLNANIYLCEPCAFKCSKQCDYNRHILTAKHEILTNPNITAQKNAKAFMCSCGKVYKHASTLCAHKKKCTHVDDMNDGINNADKNDEIPISITEPTSDATTILLLLKQNQEFKSLMVEQYTHLQESNQQNQELQQQLVDAVKNNTSSITNNNNNNNNTTNNNQRFNINFFLNDTCKDAMSITDFLRNIDVQNDELEYIGNHGYVNGMTKMIMDRLKNMDVTKRPIHCTDIKRETMYIKEDTGWCKDTEELSKLRKILSRISMNNYRSVPNWRNAHPECEVVASRTYDFCYKMMQALLGDVEDAQIRLDNKIIKTMAKTLFVNKTIINE